MRRALLRARIGLAARLSLRAERKGEQGREWEWVGSDLHASVSACQLVSRLQRDPFHSTLGGEGNRDACGCVTLLPCCFLSFPPTSHPLSYLSLIRMSTHTNHALHIYRHARTHMDAHVQLIYRYTQARTMHTQEPTRFRHTHKHTEAHVLSIG